MLLSFSIGKKRGGVDIRIFTPNQKSFSREIKIRFLFSFPDENSVKFAKI